MMQMRDWVIGIIGVIVGAIGLLSLLKILPFGLSRGALVWIAAIAGIILAYAAIVEVTNSNVLGPISIIAAGVILIISLLPALNNMGFLGSWAAFGWVGETFYKLILVVEGALMAIATFAMEL
ncbi:MAG: hypothetical protein AABX32_07785 [Nanoarchaeota archaeon]